MLCKLTLGSEIFNDGETSIEIQSVHVAGIVVLYVISCTQAKRRHPSGTTRSTNTTSNVTRGEAQVRQGTMCRRS